MKSQLSAKFTPIEIQTNDHWQVAFIERVKCRRKHFHPRVTGQPDRIETQSGGSLNRGRRGETPMLINQPDDWLGENDQPNRRRNREKHDQPHGVRERTTKFLRVAHRGAAGNKRQSDRCDRDAENAKRKLHEAKGDVEPGNWTVA